MELSCQLTQNHPDETLIRKVNVSLDAAWLTEPADGEGASDTFKLAEFGGGLEVGDFSSYLELLMELLVKQ